MKLTETIQRHNDLNRRTKLMLSVTREQYYARLQGVQQLFECGESYAIPPLIYALGDPDSRIAFDARLALEEITGESFWVCDDVRPDNHVRGREFNDEWRLWIDWYSVNHEYEENTPEIFKPYVLSLMQHREQKKLEATTTSKL